MARAYFESGKAQSRATFELFFRRPPFHGEYAILAGFELIQDILKGFQFTNSDLNFLKSHPSFKTASTEFWKELERLDLSDIEIFAIPEGSVVFPREPLMQIHGPILKVQLLESAFLNAINFSTLVATYARRIKMVSENRTLVEFGMRRAQGPNGAMTATRSSFIGGFDATSNVVAAKNLGIPVVGTMAHSFVQSFWELTEKDLVWQGESIEREVNAAIQADGFKTNLSELAAFLAYARTFPTACVLLVDTYDTLKSGVPNAIRVFQIMKKFGVRPGDIRLDSGDLVYLSRECRRMLDEAGFTDSKIFASNELDEAVIESLQRQGACIDSYGVGTRLVVSADQPALGGVYKLVEVERHPRMKISQQTEKLVFPSAKNLYRLYGRDGLMLLDLMTTASEPAPQPGAQILAHHPADPYKRAVVQASRVEPLLQPLFQKGRWLDERSLEQKRSDSLKAMTFLREDVSRSQNPAPYKVSVSAELQTLIEKIYNQEAPPSRLE